MSLLFTDIVGSTPLWERHQREMRDALERHDTIVTDAIAAFDGRVFATNGDGFAAAFSRASDAVGAALTSQRGLRAERWPAGVEIGVRMGVHTGETYERDGNHFGPPVNLAARLMGVANAGQIVLSAVTANLLDPATDVELVDLGTIRLKGIADAVAVSGVSTADLEWPDTPLVSGQVTPGNLPRSNTEWVGDPEDLRRRTESVRQHRLLTLTGSGGVGKTRTALEVGWSAIDDFPDGAWFVDLGGGADAETVIDVAATALGARKQPGMSLVESIVEWCLGRQMLLIIDNCEHVLAAVTALVEAVLSDCPAVTIIATSREPLGVAGEQVSRIPSLGPERAIELFRARAAEADTSLGFLHDGAPSTDTDAIVAICERLDGIPLAIELAAARIRSLSPTEILERLDDRFRLLGRGVSRPHRHQTLHAAVTWSYRLLDDGERRLFDRLSVFAGSFDMAAAEAVCTGDGVETPDVIELVVELVDKSMVVAARTHQRTRYRLLETMRHYGRERLDERGEAGRWSTRHLVHFADLAAVAHQQWSSPQQPTAATTFDAEWDNLRAAHSWAVKCGDATRAHSILRSTADHALFRLRHDHESWARRGIEMDADAADRAMSWAILGWWSIFSGDPGDALDHVEQGFVTGPDGEGRRFLEVTRFYALAGAGRRDDALRNVPAVRDTVEHSTDSNLRYLASVALCDASLGTDDAESALELHLKACDQHGGALQIARSHYVRGRHELLSVTSPDIERVIHDLELAMELADSAGGTETRAMASVTLAFAEMLGGRRGARAAVRRAIATSFDVRHGPAIKWALEAGALHFGQAGDLPAAAALLGHLQQQPSGLYEIAGLRDLLRSMVNPLADLDTHLDAGAALDRHAVVSYALARLGPAR